MRERERERGRGRGRGGEREGEKRDFCEVWIRVVSVPAALESVKDAVILVEGAESAAQVVVYRIHLHRPRLHVHVPYLERNTDNQ